MKREHLVKVKYAAGGIFIFTALGLIMEGSIIAGALALVLGLFLLPPIFKKVAEKLPILESNKFLRYGVYVVLFFSMAGFMPKKQKPKNTNAEKNVVEEKPQPQQEKIPEPTIFYKIIYEEFIRVDGAPSYFVLLDKVDISNEKFMLEIKGVINKITTEKGKKINIEFLDDKNLLDLMHKSHYGANTLGRALTAKEREKLARHNIASFSGELANMPYTNTLSFFPSAFADTPEIGKYVKSEEFNPNKIIYTIQNEKTTKKEEITQNTEKKDKEKELAYKREKFLKDCFTNGTHTKLRIYIRTIKADGVKYEHIDTSTDMKEDYAIVTTHFSLTNKLGVRNDYKLKAKVSYDNCEVIEILK